MGNAGSFTGQAPQAGTITLSDAAQQALADAFEDITSPIIDYHTHLAGIGTSSSCCVHEHMSSIFHPYRAYTYASGIQNEDDWDREFVSRLSSLIGHIQEQYSWGQHYLLAFDRWHDKNGVSDPFHSGLYVPNEYMMQVVAENPEMFLPCVSVHPYRKDALEELEKYAAQGVHLVKWLPNSMGIDPSDPLCDPFYEKMKELHMVLLCHTGMEHAVDPPGIDNGLGNPLRLRRPLNQGVYVIAAHCASEGEGEDLDFVEDKELKSNFQLLLRLLDDPNYEDNLFCDISAMCGHRRIGEPLTTMVERTDLHHRLVFGSDYPIPAIYFAVHTSALQKYGYITEEETKILNEIYYYNPLVFDFVCKRLVRSPNTGTKFAASVFMKNKHLEKYTEGNK